MNKRLFLCVSIGALLVIMASSGLQAQRLQRPPGPPNQTQIKQMVAELSDVLSLTEDQKVEISKLFTSHFKNMGDLMKNSGGPEGMNHSKMEKLRKKFETKVKALLTEEQQKKFDEFIKNNRPGHRDRRLNGERK